MTVKLMGVLHAGDDPKPVIDRLEREFSEAKNKPKKIALEITPAQLKIFDELYPSRKTRELPALMSAEITKLYTRLATRAKKMDHVPFIDVKLVPEAAMDHAKFWFEIYAHIRQNGANIVPVESESAFLRVATSDLKVELLARMGRMKPAIREFVKGGIIAHPIRQRYFAHKIKEKDADIAILGAANTNGVRKWLRKKGISSQVIFTTKKEKSRRILTNLLYAPSRFTYWSRTNRAVRTVRNAKAKRRRRIKDKMKKRLEA